MALEARNLELEAQKLVEAKRMAQLKQQEIKARELRKYAIVAVYVTVYLMLTES